MSRVTKGILTDTACFVNAYFVNLYKFNTIHKYTQNLETYANFPLRFCQQPDIMYSNIAKFPRADIKIREVLVRKMGVTREDVAKLAGVSGTTVSYVMNNTKNISPEVRQRVWDAAKQLNYHPSLLARGLVTKETRHIAIVVKNLQNPYYNAIQEGIQMIAAQEGYIVSVLSAHESPVDNMNIMLSRGIDGVIIASSSAGELKELLKPNIPMAVVGEDQSAGFYRKGVFSMVEAFHRLGHRRVAFLSGLPLDNPMHYRYHDFRDALTAYGMDTDPALFIDGNGVTDEQNGYEAADALLRSGVPFTGVFAVNDLMAIGAMKRFWQAGLRIPEDISIVGCDGIATTEYTTPPLSTLQSPTLTIGISLMYQLLEKLQPGRTFPMPRQPLETEFIQRESLGAAREET